MILNMEKWKGLTHNVKFCASQNLYICVGTVEDNGICKVDKRVRHTVGEVRKMYINNRVHHVFQSGTERSNNLYAETINYGNENYTLSSKLTRVTINSI